MKVLDLVVQKGFYSYNYMTGFGKVKETLPHKGKFYNYLMDKKTSDK